MNHSRLDYKTWTTLSLCLALGSLGACELIGDLGDEDSAGSGSGTDTSSTSTGTDSATTAGSGGGSGEGGDICTAEECGPAPGLPNYLCPDGITVAGPGDCVALAEGGCGWEIVECPGEEVCTDEECGPAPGAPNYLCPDGETWAGPGPCENVDGQCVWTWIECPPCCDPAEEPVCDGSAATCCSDGTWSCDASCDAGSVCVDGGTGSTGGDTGGDTGGICVDLGDSCAAGETCCDGLQCCSGVPVPPGDEYCSDMCPISDRNKKEHFLPVDSALILDKVTKLPITTWNYTFEDPSIRHLGPMAQDFKEAFDVGKTDKLIFQIDADGVALSAIQGLHAQVQTLRDEKAQLQDTVSTLQQRLDRLENLVGAGRE